MIVATLYKHLKILYLWNDVKYAHNYAAIPSNLCLIILQQTDGTAAAHAVCADRPSGCKYNKN